MAIQPTSPSRPPEVIAPGRVAVITGAASGIGLGIARRLAEVAGVVVGGIRSSRFYILTSANRNAAVLRRGEEIVAGGSPAPPFP